MSEVGSVERSRSRVRARDVRREGERGESMGMEKDWQDAELSDCDQSES